jgi:predicted transcriptional regulator
MKTKVFFDGFEGHVRRSLERAEKMSQGAPAEELGRNRGSVTRDVNKLKKLGLLRLREEVNPGHGVVQIVEPAAQKFEMHIA